MSVLPVVNGLLLAGGKSRRMGSDKASMDVAADGCTQVQRAWQVLEPLCARTFLSLREGQPDPAGKPSSLAVIRDCFRDAGPLAGILSAMAHTPSVAWLVVACDLPLLDTATIQSLLAARVAQTSPAPFIAYASNYDGLAEPLCAIYEPSSRPLLMENYRQQRLCPRHILKDANCPLVALPAGHENALDNINTLTDLDEVRERITSL